MSSAFTLAAELRWQPIDDGVMGGLSSSRATVTPERTLVFSGTVSLENNGGFASIRCAPGAFDLSTHAGMVLRVRGDGKRYLFSVKTDPAFDGVQYRAGFETRAGTWIDAAIPFSAFEPRFRGRLVRSAPPLDAGRIITLGFMIADRQAGAFRLEVDRIEPMESPCR